MAHDTPQALVSTFSEKLGEAERKLEKAADLTAALAPLVVEGKEMGIVKGQRAFTLKTEAMAIAGDIANALARLATFHNTLLLIAQGDNELGEDIDVPPMNSGGMTTQGGTGR